MMISKTALINNIDEEDKQLKIDSWIRTK